MSEINPLEMSDDEIDAALEAELARLDSAEAEVETEVEEEEIADELQQEEQEEETETDEVEASEEALEDDTTEDEVVDEEDTEIAAESADEGSEDEPVDATDDIDYKSMYEELLMPFKANGKDMQVDNVEDARKLMQMGANYNKKMAALKPNLRLMKMLENNNLLDESKLSFLIDLDKKNPEAIQKFIKESGLDPLDIDVSADSNYKQKSYTVSDSELALDNVLEEIKDTPTFSRTMDIIGNSWDQASQEEAVREPEIIKVINEQVQSGLYDQIMQVVERERVLGRLNGLSDIQAYYQVGQRLNSTEGNRSVAQSISKVKANNVNKAANTVDPKLKSRKMAASSTKSVPKTQQPPDFNPLAMSDEEFAKLVADKFI